MFRCPLYNKPNNKNDLQLYSSSLENGFTNQYLHNKNGMTPKLEWKSDPRAKSYILVFIDEWAFSQKASPQSGSSAERKPSKTSLEDNNWAHNWRHWILLNIPANVNSLSPVKVSETKNPVWNGIIQGRNSWDEYGYGGPDPPRGSGPHKYCFYIYALDTELKAENNSENLLNKLEDHILSCGFFYKMYEK